MNTVTTASHEATLVSKNLIAKNTYEMILSLSADFYFVPGQYIWLCVPALVSDDPRGNQRAFSIVSSPQEKRMIRVCFRASDSGYKKTLLSLSIGSGVIIKGPFGENFCLSETVRRYVFVAGGTGISPILSILRDENTWKNGVSITLVYANSTRENALYREEIALLSAQQKQFELYERYGQVSGSAFSAVQFHADAHWYVSGPPGFVDAVYTILQKRNISDSAMHFEENYPRRFMALGKSTHLELFPAPALSPIAQLILDETTNHITFTDIDGRILYANAAAQRLTGYAPEEMRGNTPRLWGALMGHEFYERLWRTIKIERKPFIDKIINRKKSGVTYVVLVRISPIIDRAGDLIGFIGTEEDITELERISQAKTDFVSIASHQLRTPLSIMRWYSELLLGGDVGKPSKKQRECLDEILHGARRMADLIDALLTVSRIELGTFMIEPADTDVLTVAKTIKEDLFRDSKKKLLIISEQYESALPHVQTDPKLVHMIFYNVLSNAVRYTPDGGTITIDIHRVGKGERIDGKNMLEKSIAIIISDSGCGIPEHQKHNIFTKFFRADNARSAVPDGTGLGLYIVKSLVEYMHGMIWFESTENKGTTFYVILPLAGTERKKGTVPLS